MLGKEGNLEQVQCSDQAFPIVGLLKADEETICLCGDFKQMINPVFCLE